jgi:RNA polymerase sigma-70 factor (ECF subfamily)
MYGEYSEQLLRYCLRRRGSRPEAEDAVQTTFLYAVRALGQGVVPECEPAWLYVIARNVCREQHRAATRRGPVAGDVDPDSLPCLRPDDEAELLVSLREALESMPERQRHALVLREWRGLAPREIATQLGMSPPATHALLTRARHSLAQALTAPRRAALGLGSLLWQLKPYLKPFLGGASVKAAVATVAVVSVGIGGVAADKRFGREPATAQVQVPAPVGDRQVAARDRPSVVSPVARRRSPKGSQRIVRADRRGSVPKRATPVVIGSTAPLVVLAPRTVPSDSEPGSKPRADGEAAPKPIPKEEPTRVLPLDPLPVPKTPLPTDVLPPVELPPLSPPVLPSPEDPSIGLPPVELPPVHVPGLPGLP